MKRRQIIMTAAFFALIVSACLQAATIRYVGPSDGSWNDPDNWTIDGLPAGRVPSSADDDYVQLYGATVRVSEPSSFRQFSTSNGGGTVHIDDGGILAGTQPYTVRYSTYRVNNGGQFPLGTSWSIRSSIIVNEGGTMTGGASIGITDARSITVHGSFRPRSATTAAGFQVGSSTRTGILDVSATGTIILGLFGDNSNTYFNVVGPTSGTRLTLNNEGSSVLLQPQEGYVPEPGHSYKLWSLADGSLATMNIGDGSNISIVGSSYGLDTSLWESEGIVSVIPEPATLGLLTVGVLAMLRRRR